MDQEQEPLLRVMSLHALTYCERLFYLEEVEEIRLADAAVFAGRALHEEMKQREQENGLWHNEMLTSQDLGLIGKLDYLRRRDGQLIPYELKRGRVHRDAKTKRAMAWETDKIQLGAYALLLEEATQETIAEGRIHYHREGITVRVPINDDLRGDVLMAIARARLLRESTERPPVTPNDRLCLKCSLAPVCLPEEERLAADQEWEPVRLFPMERETRTVHVVEPYAKIGRSGDALKVQVGPENRQIPLHEIHALVLHGFPQMTTQALQTCARSGIGVHWISGGGYYTAGLWAGAGHVQKRIRQYAALTQPDVCLELCKKLVMAKVEGALRYLLRTTRGKERSEIPEYESSVRQMRLALKSIAKADSPDSIRGYEGMAGKAYFALLPALIRPEVPDSLRLAGRNRRPPKDRFNALLSFGYSLLYQAILQAVMVVGLDPALGFFHRPRSSAYPLVLDLMELFRLPVWDLTVLGSLNRLQWDEEDDFEVTKEKVWLSDAGRRKAIQLFEKRLDEVWKHPVVDYSLSYARLMELEVRLLEKEWAGQAGLFARMRLK